MKINPNNYKLQITLGNARLQKSSIAQLIQY